VTHTGRYRCFFCNKEIYSNIGDDNVTVNEIAGGLCFCAYGNYGSTVFDPIENDEFLRIIICDECVQQGSWRKIIDHVYDIKRGVTAELELFEI